MTRAARLWHHIDTCAIIVSDAVVFGTSFLLFCMPVMWLAICTEIYQFDTEDARRAATAAGIVRGLASPAPWPIVKAAGKVIQTPGNKPSKRPGIEPCAGRTALQNVTCQPMRSGALTEPPIAPRAAPTIP
jgi:hypothetical protein